MGIDAPCCEGYFYRTKNQHLMDLQFLKKGFLMLLFLNAVNGFSQTSDDDRAAAWQLNATYKGDFVSNFRGGIATGSTYLGLADLFLHFNTEKAGHWKGGDFLVRGANSHGGEPSANLIGDFQVVSNIEAGNHTFLYELWFKQTISNTTTTIGLQDLNAEFANSEVSSLFLNSSFGIHSVIADNISAPIFPITKPGITFSWDVSKKMILKMAVYKGCPIDFDSNPYNLKWNLDYEKGLLWITESQFSWTGTHEKNNVLKAGVFFHQHCPESNEANSETGNKLTNDYGFYLVGDHQVFSTGDERRGLKIFYQIGVSPLNNNFGYMGAGCAYSGLLSPNGTDVLGLAFADGMLNDDYGRDETTFELTYKVQVTSQIYLQPDLQYVVHPGGNESQLKNATVGLLRLGMEF
jgi:porin